jgi:hypothetical protein
LVSLSVCECGSGCKGMSGVSFESSISLPLSY